MFQLYFFSYELNFVFVIKDLQIVRGYVSDPLSPSPSLFYLRN